MSICPTNNMFDIFKIILLTGNTRANRRTYIHYTNAEVKIQTIEITYSSIFFFFWSLPTILLKLYRNRQETLFNYNRPSRRIYKGKGIPSPRDTLALGAARPPTFHSPSDIMSMCLVINIAH